MPFSSTPYLVGVAKRPKAPDCGSGIRGFESHHPPHKENPSASQKGFLYGMDGAGFEQSNATVRRTVAGEGWTEPNIYFRQRRKCKRIPSPACPLLLCRRVFFMEWTVRDSNNQMQQSGGLLPARAGPSRTFIFAKGENVTESHHPLAPYYLLSPHRNGHLGDIVAAAFAPVGRPFQIDGANGTCGFDALFLHIYGQRPNCLRNPLIWTAIIDA